MDPDKMVDFLTEHQSCTCCLSWLHAKSNCPYENIVCTMKESVTPCGKPHNYKLHKSKRPVIINHVRTTAPEGDDILAPSSR